MGKLRIICPKIRDLKTMADKLMYIPNDNTQKYLFCRLQLVVRMLGNSTLVTYQSNFNIVLKVVQTMNKKTFL